MSVDFDKVLSRYGQFWEMSNEDRPLVYMYGPKGYSCMEKGPGHADFKEAWLDTEHVIKLHRQRMDKTFYLGEGYPMLNPNLGPDVLAAAVCKELNIVFGDRTVWAEPCLEDYDIPPLQFDENSFWWQKIVEITKAALEDSHGDYLVGITDLHPGADAVVSLRGPEDTAMDLYDDPEGVQKLVWEFLEVFKQMAGRLHRLISQKQKACVNWMTLAHPDELWYPPCCDFSCMISGDAFEEFFIPEIEKEIQWLPHSIYHLDGPGALRHLDRLLQIKELDGIQWVYGAGQPSARHWGEVLQKIQAAGKRIQLYCEPDDLVPLSEMLDPRGVQLKCLVPSEEEGKWLLKEMERACRARHPQFFVK